MKRRVLLLMLPAGIVGSLLMPQGAHAADKTGADGGTPSALSDAPAATDSAMLRKEATRGDSQAQYDLAIALDCGCGVKRDRAEALQWLRKAAEQGHVGAQSALGWKYMTGDGVRRDESVAFAWLRRAAERGNTSAQNNLGVLYAQGRGVTADLVEAERWFRSAAEKGAADAQRNLDALLAGRRRDMRSISEPPLRRA
jgi:hypothetical protein